MKVVIATDGTEGQAVWIIDDTYLVCIAYIWIDILQSLSKYPAFSLHVEIFILQSIQFRFPIVVVDPASASWKMSVHHSPPKTQRAGC